MLYLKRFKKLFFLIICLSAGLFVILNLPVTSKQGINYEVKTIKMPLYIKIIEFFDRDYHYKELVEKICQGCNNDEEKVLAIFEWVHQNIKRDIPEDWSIVDDHVWNIIVRRYGTDDQFSEVFTTLCVYAGIPAFRNWISPKNCSRVRIAISYVKLNGCWVIFDPYYKVYFKNNNDEIATIEEIIQKPGILKVVRNRPDRHGVKYLKYFNNLKPVKESKGLMRAKQQMPVFRLSSEVKERIRR